MESMTTERDHYENLVDRAAGPAWRAARRFASDDAAASDAVQEAFLRLVDGRVAAADLAVEGDVALGLRALAVRLARDERRGGLRRRLRELRRAADWPRLAASSSDLVAIDDEAQAVWREVDRLPERLREPLVLRFAEGLSFSAIGRALDLSESAAHERVRLASARLRQRMSASAAPAVLSLTRESGPGASRSPLEVLHFVHQGSGEPEAPADLLPALRELPRVPREVPAAAASAGIGAPLVGALAAVLAAGVWAIGGLADRGVASPPPALAAMTEAAPRAGEPIRTAARQDDAERRAATPVERASGAPPSEFVLTGRVLDGRGHGVPGATVRGTTVERWGKFALASTHAIADEKGAYELRVEFDGRLAGRTSARLALEAGHLGYVLSAGAEVDASPGGRASRDLVVTLPEGERAGAYELDLLVADDEGRPVAGALVELTHVTPREGARVGPDVPFSEWSSQASWLHLREGRGRTGADGRIRVSGERLGAKSLWIEPPGALAYSRTSLAIIVEGTQARDIVVAQGLSVRGQLAWHDGKALSDAQRTGMTVNAVIEDARWRSAEIAADGSFEIRGLPPRALELRVEAGWQWPPAAGERPSPARLRLEPRAEPYALALKPRTLARDVGIHDAELHGVVVDSLTEEGVDITDADVFTWSLWSLDPALFETHDLERDLLPNLIHAPPVQRMLGPNAVGSPELHQVGLSPGIYMAQVTPRGRYGVAGPFVLRKGEVRSDVRVVVGVPMDITVRVVDGGGRPVPGAWVFATGEGPYSDGVIDSTAKRYAEVEGRGSFYGNGGRRTGEDGAASLGGMPPGLRVRVVAIVPGKEPVVSAASELEGGEPLRVELELR